MLTCCARSIIELEGSISTLHAQLDKSTRDLETAKIALKHMQEERNSAVNSVAIAIANNEDLKVSMEELKDEIQRLRMDNYELGKRAELKREEWKDREDWLRRKARAAKETAIVAQGVMKEAAKRDVATAAAVTAAEKEVLKTGRREQRAKAREAEREAEREQERVTMETQVRLQKKADEKREQERVVEQQKKLDNLIKQQLKELRPDLYTSKSAPLLGESLRINHAFVQTAKSRNSKERVISIPKRSGRHVTIDDAEDETIIRRATTRSSGDQEIAEKGDQGQVLGDDTMMSISVSSQYLLRSLPKPTNIGNSPMKSRRLQKRSIPKEGRGKQLQPRLKQQSQRKSNPKSTQKDPSREDPPLRRRRLPRNPQYNHLSLARVLVSLLGPRKPRRLSRLQQSIRARVSKYRLFHPARKT